MLHCTNRIAMYGYDQTNAYLDFPAGDIATVYKQYSQLYMQTCRYVCMDIQVITNQPVPVRSTATLPPIPWSYIGFSVLVMECCCWLLGCIAVDYSRKVSDCIYTSQPIIATVALSIIQLASYNIRKPSAAIPK